MVLRLGHWEHILVHIWVVYAWLVELKTDACLSVGRWGHTRALMSHLLSLMLWMSWVERLTLHTVSKVARLLMFHILIMFRAIVLIHFTGAFNSWNIEAKFLLGNVSGIAIPILIVKVSRLLNLLIYAVHIQWLMTTQSTPDCLHFFWFTSHAETHTWFNFKLHCGHMPPIAFIS